MRARTPITRPIVVLATTALVSLAGFGRPAAALACGGWAIAPTPNPATGSSQLLGIGEVSSTDVWAVGLSNDPATGAPLAEHWNDTSWSIVPTASTGGWLWDADGAASNDVWAAGDGVLEHWNGSTWSSVAIPLPSGGASPRIRTIEAVAANDVYAAGWYTARTVERTLLLHWNGTAWSRLATPNQGRRISTELWGVSIRSSSDIWTVGRYLDRAGEHTYSAHWNGTSWSKPAMPATVATFDTFLGRVADVGTAGAWAVGMSGETALIERWQSGAWHIVNGVAGVTYLDGVLAFGTGDVYASGNVNGAAFVEHWNGTAWSTVPTPSVSPAGEGLNDLDGTSDADIWAAGDQGDGSGDLLTLVEHAC